MEGILPDSVYAQNAERMGLYEHQLHNHPDAAPVMEYLTKDRGLTTETIKHFHLGAVIDPDPMDSAAVGKISIPHLNARGVAVLRFRSMPETDGPKYWQPPGSRISIYNVLEFAVPRSEIAVTEGEIDTMTLWQSGIPAVGFPGAQSFRDHHRHLFDGYQQVTIAVDNDDKGAGAAFAEKLAARVPGPLPITMPSGHDVNSYYVAAGREALRSHLKMKD